MSFAKLFTDNQNNTKPSSFNANRVQKLTHQKSAKDLPTYSETLLSNSASTPKTLKSTFSTATGTRKSVQSSNDNTPQTKLNSSNNTTSYGNTPKVWKTAHHANTTKARHTPEASFSSLVEKETLAAEKRRSTIDKKPSNPRTSLIGATVVTEKDLTPRAQIKFFTEVDEIDDCEPPVMNVSSILDKKNEVKHKLSGPIKPQRMSVVTGSRERLNSSCMTNGSRRRATEFTSSPNDKSPLARKSLFQDNNLSNYKSHMLSDSYAQDKLRPKSTMGTYNFHQDVQEQEQVEIDLDKSPTNLFALEDRTSESSFKDASLKVQLEELKREKDQDARNIKMLQEQISQLQNLFERFRFPGKETSKEVIKSVIQKPKEESPKKQKEESPKRPKVVEVTFAQKVKEESPKPKAVVPEETFERKGDPSSFTLHNIAPVPAAGSEIADIIDIKDKEIEMLKLQNETLKMSIEFLRNENQILKVSQKQSFQFKEAAKRYRDLANTKSQECVNLAEEVIRLRKDLNSPSSLRLPLPPSVSDTSVPQSKCEIPLRSEFLSPATDLAQEYEKMLFRRSEGNSISTIATENYGYETPKTEGGEFIKPSFFKKNSEGV